MFERIVCAVRLGHLLYLPQVREGLVWAIPLPLQGCGQMAFTSRFCPIIALHLRLFEDSTSFEVDSIQVSNLHSKPCLILLRHCFLAKRISGADLLQAESIPYDHHRAATKSLARLNERAN